MATIIVDLQRRIKKEPSIIISNEEEMKLEDKIPNLNDLY